MFNVVIREPPNVAGSVELCRPATEDGWDIIKSRAEADVKALDSHRRNKS